MAQETDVDLRITALDIRTARMEEAIERLGQRLSNTPGGQCTAAMPHPNQLVYMRGPNIYACQCGQSYKKDGTGGLTEA